MVSHGLPSFLSTGPCGSTESQPNGYGHEFVSSITLARKEPRPGAWHRGLVPPGFETEK